MICFLIQRELKRMKYPKYNGCMFFAINLHFPDTFRDVTGGLNFTDRKLYFAEDRQIDRWIDRQIDRQIDR